MAIINPANENQNYCISSSSATWFVNGNQLISFNQSDLTNGTKFVKQNVNGLAYKIIWDGGGSEKEHIINNPDNYSYSFQPRNAWSCTIILGGGTYPISYSGQKIFQSFGFFRYSAPLTFFPCDPEPDFVFKPAGYIYYHFYAQFTDGSLQRYTTWDSYFGVGFPAGQLSYKRNNFISSNNQYSIKIKDNGVTNIYQITNTNSVEIIYSSGEIKYTFTAGSQSLNQQYSSTQNISLKCGIDCPPETCVKCRDGDYVCCYGGDGTVIERVHDPNNEISDAC